MGRRLKAFIQAQQACASVGATRSLLWLGSFVGVGAAGPQMPLGLRIRQPHTLGVGAPFASGPEAAEEPLALMGWEGVLGHRVEMAHEEDGQCADGEEQDGQPEAELVHHLPDPHPVLDLL